MRLVLDGAGEHGSQWAAISSIAAKIGCTTDRHRRLRAEAHRGRRVGAGDPCRGAGGIHLDPAIAAPAAEQPKPARPAARPALTLSEREAEVLRLVPTASAWGANGGSLSTVVRATPCIHV